MDVSEIEIREMKKQIQDLRKSVRVMFGERNSILVMITAEYSLKKFLSDQPDLYSDKDLKVRHGRREDLF